MILTLALCSTMPAVAQNSYSLKGTATTKAIGKQEVAQDQVLHVTKNGSELKVALSNFSVFNFKGIGITGTVYRDANNQVTGYKDLKITGISGVKIKSVTGLLSDTKADIVLSGKVAGMFNFVIYYKAK